MFKMVTKLKDIIIRSLYRGDSQNPSSSRIFSYIMMFVILLLGLSHVAIEIGNAIIVWKKGGGATYVPNWQSITIIGMWLAHQLTLLGIYKKVEVDIKQDQSNFRFDNTQTNDTEFIEENETPTITISKDPNARRKR